MTWRQGPPDVKFVSSSILPASDRDEIERERLREWARERETETERESESERERPAERERGDSCMCELAYLHLRVTTINDDLSLII